MADDNLIKKVLETALLEVEHKKLTSDIVRLCFSRIKEKSVDDATLTLYSLASALGIVLESCVEIKGYEQIIDHLKKHILDVATDIGKLKKEMRGEDDGK